MTHGTHYMQQWQEDEIARGDARFAPVNGELAAQVYLKERKRKARVKRQNWALIGLAVIAVIVIPMLG